MTSAGEERRPALVRIALRLVAPLLLVLVLWKLGDPHRLLDALAHASLLPLLGAVALNVPVSHFKVLRWRALLRERGWDYSVARCWAAILPSFYLGAVTPGRVGDVVRIQYLTRDLGTPYAEGLAVTVMDRFLDLYVLAAFVALGIAHFTAVLRNDVAYATWAAVGLATLTPLLFVIPGVAERLVGRIYRRLARGQDEGLNRFLVALRALVGWPLLYGVGTTVLSFLIHYVQGWLVAASLGLDLGFTDVMGLMAITSLLGLMPISLSGLGIRELFLALVFPLLGWTAAAGVAFGLLVFATAFLANTLAGFVAWQIQPPPFGESRDENDAGRRVDQAQRRD